MLDFFYKKSKPFLVLDIEDESIKTLIVKKDRNKLVVLGSALGQYDENHMKRSILKSVEKAHENLIFFSGREEGENSDWKNLPVLLSLPSRTLKARVVSHKLERKDHLKISKVEERDILQNILKRTKNKVGQEFNKDFGILPTDIHWTNFKVLETEINGYPVPNLSGFCGGSINFKVLSVFLPKNDFKNIVSILYDLGLKVSKIVHIAEALSESDNKVLYPQDLWNIKNLPKSLENSQYIPTLLMSYYAKEIF